ncbi:hypothetical protein GGI64_001877 [Rhizobium leguminosarum]|uniref:Uncharacterized protein n=3 Tax=Rhizobium leguminosarum TaxID=384 RepID=A0A7Z0DWR9_RHILE|nr:hypothetical protein [Rhizobium leguminosarum]ACI58445.1 hypothetical protein Rleg2_5256 [Rhizobium leguminosarum bv. trifolii WSM2304]EJB06111.1 hypothetical protein Rleg9DRAFT_5032 [Rhizobium leguminosarum bv. trifolii WSM597]MBB5664002.1 hypothetical protein [Rhizobium leguminosarum]MBB6219291.1 hypothetical protein [Rhizobium leguminosarum]NYJ10830.1 hypothetical protein [Rhizobium leguminosarum]
MSDDVRTRNSTTSAERLSVMERTNAAARETLAEERLRREAKTERLRKARLQAQDQARQL